MDRLNEDDFRRLAFDYLRGDLDAETEERFEEHLVESAEFADYVSRLQDMLQSPAKAADVLTPEIDKDALFGRISREIAGESTQPGVVLEFPQLASEPELEHEEPVPAQRPWLRFAAAALVALGLGFLIYQAVSSQSQPGEAPVELAETDKAPAPDAGTEIAAPVQQSVGLADLDLVPTRSDSVKVFAAKEARWSMNEEEIDINRGTLLVEFVPKDKEQLSVRTKHFDIRILGTVFYASEAGDGSVGVITGKVEVVPNVGEPITLVSGQEYIGGQGVRPIEAPRMADAERHVNVEAHLDRLAEAKVARDQPPQTAEKTKPTPATKPEAKPQPSIVWRDRANRALRAGEYAEAADVLEQALADLEPNDPTRGAIRLDLARIYINRLKRPSQAVVHLRRFVKSRPNDVATPLAKSELCKILKDSGRADPLCED